MLRVYVRSVDGKMIEIKVSYDPDPELALNNAVWAPLSLTAEQAHIDGPIEMEKARRCAANRTDRQALDTWRRTPTKPSKR